jgi:adenosylcobinamide-phosphate synthase
MKAFLVLLIGWLADRLFGDPSWLPHPVVGFGKVIALFERLLNRGRWRMFKGAVVTLFLIAITFVVFWYGLRWIDSRSVYAGMAVKAIFVFYCLAGTTLIREVREVFRAVNRSLEEGRQQVARIVGRDTSQLSVLEVRTAALETLAENLSDGVVAPLFWYALLGVPGMVAYKMINTLDSMIGYKTKRYRQFGCWAAHIDDIANYVPSRLTALMMLLVSGKIRLLPFVTWFGRQNSSPNSGYPEAALAGILDCRFGGPHTYFGEYFEKPYIGTKVRELTDDDMEKAVRINRRVETLTVLLILLIRWARFTLLYIFLWK